MAVFTLETDDPSETVNPSSKPVSDGSSVSSVKKELSCETSRGLKCENKTYKLKRCIVNITEQSTVYSDLLCTCISLGYTLSVKF